MLIAGIWVYWSKYPGHHRNKLSVTRKHMLCSKESHANNRSGHGEQRSHLIFVCLARSAVQGLNAIAVNKNRVLTPGNDI